MVYIINFTVIFSGIIVIFFYKTIGYVPSINSYMTEISIFIWFITRIFNKNSVYYKKGTIKNYIFMLAIYGLFTNIVFRYDILGYSQLFKGFKQYVFYLIYLLFLLKDKEENKKHLKSLKLFLIISAGINIFLFVIGGEKASILIMGYSTSGKTDIGLKFATYNAVGVWKAFGTFLEPATAGIWYVVAYYLFKKYRWLFFIATLMTMSRTSIAILLIYMMFLFLKNKNMAKFIINFLLIVSIVIALIFILSDEKIFEGINKTYFNTNSMQKRVSEVWKESINYLTSLNIFKMLFGIPAMSITDSYKNIVYVVDNNFMTLWSDVGIIGLIIYLGYHAYRAKRDIFKWLFILSWISLSINVSESLIIAYFTLMEEKSEDINDSKSISSLFRRNRAFNKDSF